MAWLAEVSATFIRWLCIAAFAALLAAPASAQETAKDYPNRPVTLIVPFAAGGGLDMIARQLQPLLEQRWGKPLIIENRPGAGTSIGAAAAAKAAPDGYTLLFGTTSPLSIAVNVYKSVPYDPVKDFVPVARIGNAAFVFITTPNLKVNTLAEFIKLAKAKPNEFSFGSGGTGSMQHLFAEMLQAMAGIKMVHVPYRGDNPVITDIIAGHIPVAFVEMGVAMPFIQAGKVVPLGVSSAQRVPAMPNVPTISESGVPGFDAVSWQMFVAPAGTPRPIVDKLFADIGAVLEVPEVKKDFIEAGRIPAQQTSIEEMESYIKSERDKWRKVTEMAGVAGSQ
jgi:tripartite-type tricarboxylate transporter receptor subunit TctC